MKQNKNMLIASLFEDVNYITVYCSKSGNAIGRIYNENYGSKKKPSYIAVIISSGVKGKVKTIQHGEAFILLGRMAKHLAEVIHDTKNVSAWQVWKKSDLQRLLIGTYKSKDEANDEADFRRNSFNKHLTWEILPVYENKQQISIF